eukprot:scaffold84570_cov30-Tisochrysis_lutea.AAC.4
MGAVRFRRKRNKLELNPESATSAGTQAKIGLTRALQSANLRGHEDPHNIPLLFNTTILALAPHLP